MKTITFTYTVRQHSKTSKNPITNKKLVLKAFVEQNTLAEHEVGALLFATEFATNNNINAITSHTIESITRLHIETSE